MARHEHRQFAGIHGSDTTIGLVADTVLRTGRGPLRMDQLRAGDRLAGAGTVAHVLAYPVFEDTVRIQRDALGPGLPAQALCVGTGQRLSVLQPKAMALVGHAAPWVRADDLMVLPGVVPGGRAAAVLYLCVLQSPGTVQVGGVELEPLVPSAPVLASLPKALRAELTRYVPEIARPAVWAQWADGRPALDPREVRWLWDSTHRSEAGRVGQR